MPFPRSARALRLEFKRNVVPYVLPLLAAVFYFDTLRTADGFAPSGPCVRPRSAITCCSSSARSPAAWPLGRGRARGAGRPFDLVAPTPRAAWARRSTALAGTLCWMLLAFLAGVAALYIQTAVQATWGGPPLWPVFVGAFGVIVVTVIGFTCGVLFPGRFTAPLVAIGVLVVYQIGLRQALGVTASSSTYALLSPATARRSSIRASTITSRRTCRSCRSCS